MPKTARQPAHRSAEFIQTLTRSPIHQRFWTDPDFADAVLFKEAVRPWRGPRLMRESVIKNKWTLVASANSCGKSHEAAKIAIRFLLSHFPAYVVVTSSSWKTLLDTLMPHILQRSSKILQEFFPFFDTPTATEWWPAGGLHRWAVLTASPQDPENIAGRHNDHVLVISDESSALSHDIGTAVAGIVTRPGDRVLFMANPIVDSGYFHQLFHSPSELFHRFTFDLFDTPNFRHNKPVIPGMPLPEWAETLAASFGEDSDIYQARVRGRFPTAGSRTLVSAPMIDAATRLPEPDAPALPYIIGVDVAVSQHGDATVIAVRDQKQLVLLESYSGAGRIEHPELVARIAQLIAEYDPEDVNLDSGSLSQIGADLRSKGFHQVNDIKFSGRAHDPKTYANQRAEMFQNLSNALRLHKLRIPPALARPLIAEAGIKRSNKHSIKIQVESKDEIFTRIGRSPDHLDAVAITYASLPGHRSLEFLDDSIVLSAKPFIRPIPDTLHHYSIVPENLAVIPGLHRPGFFVRAAVINQFSPSAFVLVHIDSHNDVWTIAAADQAFRQPHNFIKTLTDASIDHAGQPLQLAHDLLASTDTNDYPERLISLYLPHIQNRPFLPQFFPQSELSGKAGFDAIARRAEGSIAKKDSRNHPCILAAEPWMVRLLRRARTSPQPVHADTEFQPSQESLLGGGGPFLQALRMVAIHTISA